MIGKIGHSSIGPFLKRERWKRMIGKEEFEESQKLLSPTIKGIFDSNVPYIGIYETVRWCLVWDDNCFITATTSRETNVISVNMAFVWEAIRKNRLFEVEYFVIHEMRHVFQHIQIKNYKEGKETSVDPEQIKLWIKEGENYAPSVGRDGEENSGYFKQDIEIDAYAFSFAVMSHKYSGRYDGLLYVPPIYKNELKEKYDSTVKELAGFLQ